MHHKPKSGALWQGLAVAALAAAAQPALAGVVLSDEAAKKLQALAAKRGLKAGQPILIDDMMFGSDLASIRGFTPGNRWPSAAIPIVFDPSLDAAKRNAFMQGCALWSAAGISCVPRTNQTNYVKVQQRFGDWCGGSDSVSCSYVGMIGRPQELNISVNHWGMPAVIAHEIGHAIGLVHEQMRSDRGRRIQVFLQNARAGSESQFNPVGGRTLSAYDHKSIMHYQACAFAKFADCWTNPAHRVIEIKHCRYKDIPQPLSVPTDFDVYSVRTLYGLPITSNPIDYVPPFEPVKVPCGPSCRTVGGVKYGRVNYNEFTYSMPPVPNPLPSIERICRSLGQSVMPDGKRTVTKGSKRRLIVTIKGNCGCPNTI